MHDIKISDDLLRNYAVAGNPAHIIKHRDYDGCLS